MSAEVDKFVKNAMRLSIRQRAELVTRLLETLEVKQEQSKDEIDQAWEEELKRRIKEIEDGKVKSVPWEKAEKMIFEDETTIIACAHGKRKPYYWKNRI